MLEKKEKRKYKSSAVFIKKEAMDKLNELAKTLSISEIARRTMMVQVTLHKIYRGHKCNPYIAQKLEKALKNFK